MKHVLIACALAATSLNAIAAPPPVADFRAEYAVYRNDKELGRATFVLSSRADGTAEFRSDTKGTEGIARMIGLDVAEISTFRWHEGKPEGVSYDYRQDALKKKQRRVDFDWRANEARVDDNGKAFRFPINAGVVDKRLVTIALMADLARGAREMRYDIAVKDHVEQWAYKVAGEETLRLPGGTMDTVRVERVESEHGVSCWFAPKAGYAPVQIEQHEGKGDNVTLKLLTFGKS